MDIEEIYLIAGNSPRPAQWVLEKSLDGKKFQIWALFSNSETSCRKVFRKEIKDGCLDVEKEVENIYEKKYGKMDYTEIDDEDERTGFDENDKENIDSSGYKNPGVHAMDMHNKMFQNGKDKTAFDDKITKNKKINSKITTSNSFSTMNEEKTTKTNSMNEKILNKNKIEKRKSQNAKKTKKREKKIRKDIISQNTRKYGENEESKNVVTTGGVDRRSSGKISVDLMNYSVSSFEGRDQKPGKAFLKSRCEVIKKAKK